MRTYNRKTIYGLIVSLAFVSNVVAQEQAKTSAYVLDITGYPEKEIFQGHLNLGGSNPQGKSIDLVLLHFS